MENSSELFLIESFFLVTEGEAEEITKGLALSIFTASKGFPDKPVKKTLAALIPGSDSKRGLNIVHTKVLYSPNRKVKSLPEPLVIELKFNFPGNSRTLYNPNRVIQSLKYR
jgi:hypothetical protein